MVKVSQVTGAENGHTCTAVKNGKMKLKASCKTGKERGDTWDNHTIVAANTASAAAQLSNAQRYQQLLKDGNYWAEGYEGCRPTISYAGIQLQHAALNFLCFRTGSDDHPGPNANFRGASLHGASLRGASFQNTDLTNANLSNTSLASLAEGPVVAAQPSYFPNDNFTNVNFQNAELIGVDFTGSVFTNVHWGQDGLHATFCPDGTSSADDGGTCVGHGHDGTGNGPGHGGL